MAAVLVPVFRAPFRRATMAGRAGMTSGGGACRGRVVADDDGADDRGDLVAGHADAPGVLADRFGVPRLVDAEGPDPAVRLLDHVAADPADAVPHLLVADLGRLGAGSFEFLQVRPGVGAANDVEVHNLPHPVNDIASLRRGLF